jgi:site-specific DNA-methyltransferase (adenine-specific)
MISEVHNVDFKIGTKSFPDKFFDLLIADPQYGIKESAHRNISRTKLAKTKMYRKEFWDFDIPSQEDFDEMFRISKNQIIFGINYFLGKRDIPFSSGRIIWDKCNEGTNFSDCEIAYCSFHHSTRLFRFLWNGMLQGTAGDGAKMQGNKKLNQKRIHPTEKPIPIYSWILRKYAKPGDKIVDTHLGSGSSQIACYEGGYDFWGYEIDKFYFDKREERFNIFKAQQKLQFSC